jgi:Saxitoxin biosynthesis operon protein SxtJ
MIRINWNPTGNELRVFALGQFALVAMLASGIHKRGGSWSSIAILVGVSLLIGLVGTIRPQLVRWCYFGWMIAVFPIGLCVSYLLLASVFWLLVFPVGILLRCFGVDPLTRRFEPTRSTYWARRDPMPPASRYFRQF